MASLSCPTCGNPLRPGTKFCASCGAPIAAVPVPPTTLIGSQPPPKEAAPIQGNACPNCSAPLRLGAKFCPACGAKIQVAPTHYAGEETQLVKTPEISEAAAPPRKASARFLLFHGGMIAILAACLVVSLSGTLVLDLTNIKHTPTAPVITPLPADFGAPPTARPEQRAVSFLLSPTGRFGLFASGQSLSESIRGKLLTFSPMGETNNTRLWIDGQTPVFGAGGNLAQKSLPGGAVMTTWNAFSLTVTQTLEIVVGSENLGDTLRIRYDIRNADQATHEVGLRLILDALIGKNDGVPFVIPGQEGITQDAVELLGDAIPDSIRALENPELANPGVIVNLTLRGGDATPPDRVTISGWLDSEAPWDPFPQLGGVGAPLKRGGDQNAYPDSAIGIYYLPKNLEPGMSRHIVFYYGLGNLSSAASGNKKFGLFAPAKVSLGDSFYLTAVVARPAAGETVRLELPDGFVFGKNEKAEKEVKQQNVDYTQLSWLVFACKQTDSATLQAILNPGDKREKIKIKVEPVGITRPGGVCP